MNAARPTFSAGFSPSSLSPAPETQATPRARLPRGVRGAKPQPEAPAPEGDEYAACLSQARICREQAQEAARLKRFKAAVGLFQTAISLCQRALTLRKPQPEPAAVVEVAEPDSVMDGASDGEARAYLQVLTVEMSAYDELARSMNRPLAARASERPDC